MLRQRPKRFNFFLVLCLLINLALAGLDGLNWPPTTGGIAQASNGSTGVEVRVTDAGSGQPVPEASVSLRFPVAAGAAGGPGTTGRDGFVRLDNLNAPDKTPVEITVTAPGYQTWTIKDVYLVTADTLRISASLSPGKPAATEIVQALTPRWSSPGGQGVPGPTPGPQTPQSRPGLNYSDSNPPATIRVYRSATGTVDTVDFTFYVKHVLPSEWIPGWLPASLQAGAMAVKTYGWYWTNFVKYPGQNYDVKDNYADMAYNPNVSYASTDSAVDAVASYRMTRSGAIFQAHFCAGVQGNDTRTDTQCGNTPGNWISQWGSQDYAQQGKDFTWILTYYYDNIALTATVGQPEVVVDNTGSGAAFVPTYTMTPWQSASNCSSVNGTFLYTTNSQTQTADHNEVYWMPSLPQAGYYDVWVNVPGCSATTTNARYQVHYGGGSSTTVPLNQYNVTGFTKLGNWLFQPDATSFVYLDDVTGETSGTTRVGVDAIKWVYTGPPPVTLNNLSVTPAAATINRGATRQFAATGTYSNGSTADLTGSVTWASSNTGVATINAGGLATGTGGGSATISATLNNKTGTASLTVQASFTVGQGSAYSQVFNDAYTRRGGQANLGLPTNTVSQYGASGVYWQPTGGQGNPSGLGGIFHHQAGGADPSSIRAYVISGGSYNFYMTNGGPSNAYGPPTSDEFQNLNNNWQVNFANGYFADSSAGIHYAAWPSSFTAWKTSYFNNASLYSGPSLVQDEGTAGSLNFSHDWGANLAPAPGQGLTFNNNWSARWERTYTFTPGYYRFTLCGDDGIRLYLGGNTVINQWKVQGGTCYDYTTGYTANTAVPIKIEYYQGSGGASISFSVTPVTSTVVTKTIDDGSAGTLSDVLSNAAPYSLITFDNALTNITFATGSGALPAVKPGINLLGRCGPGGPQITIDGSNVSGDGLTLQGSNRVSGLWVRRFPGKQLVTVLPGNQFTLGCLKTSKT
jgi:hypothetical protein